MREVEAALADLESAVAAGRVSDDDPPLADLLERWMEHIAGIGRVDSTMYHYRQYIDREIVPVLGAIRLSKLKALDIDRLYTKLHKRGLAPATVRQIHAILRASLNQAERWGLVQRNVAKLASAPSQPQREQHPPSVEEVVALMAAAKRIDPLFGLYIRVMVATGARRAEVCGLRWSDVDFDDGVLPVERSYSVVPGARGTDRRRRALPDGSSSTRPPSRISPGGGSAPESWRRFVAWRSTRVALGTSSPEIRLGRQRGDLTPPTFCGRRRARNAMQPG